MFCERRLLARAAHDYFSPYRHIIDLDAAISPL